MFKSERVIVKCETLTLKPSKLMAVDQFLSGDFNKNDAGWFRNDLSALAAAQTREQYEAILRRLKEMPSSSNIPEGTKLEDAFNFIRPRYVQTENEFADFAEFMTKKGLEAQEAAYAAERAKQVVVEPVKEPDSSE